MKLAQASVAPGSPPQALGNPRLTTLAGTAPTQVYRHTAYLRFACGDLAQSLRVEPDSARLKGSFEVLRYDATSAAEPALKATLRQSGNAVIVDLGAPRRVVAVEVDPRRLSAGATFELYRLDGDTPASKPSASASPGSDSRFLQPRTQAGVVIFEGPSGAAVFSLDGRPLELDAGQRARVRLLLEGLAAVDFTDARFLLRATASARDIPIAPREVTQIGVDSYPTGPRIGLALPVPGNPTPDPASAAFFWSVPGEVGNDVPAAQGRFDLGAALGKTLASGLERFALLWREAGAGALPAAVDVALVLESDAPCTIQISEFELTYHLTRVGLSPEEEKRVLRFADRSALQQIAFQVPGNATVRSVRLPIDDSLRNDRPALPAQASPSAAGCLLDGSRWAAQAFSPAAAISVQGVSLALLAVEVGTRIRVTLRQDSQGAPAGSVLAEAELDVARAGVELWPTASLDATLVLATEPVWMLVRAIRGRAIWLCTPGHPGLRVLTAADGGGSHELESLQGCFLLSSADAQATSLTQLLAARIGSQAGVLDAATSAIDLTAATNAFLSARASASAVDVPVTLSVTAMGSVTVYPPEIEYDL